MTNFHNFLFFLPITVNQYVSDYLISTVCVAEYMSRAMICVAEYMSRAMICVAEYMSRAMTSQPDKAIRPSILRQCRTAQT